MSSAYLAGIAVALNQFKVPPVMQFLVNQLNVDLTTGGWLMSSFAVTGVILGVPAAIVLRKLGPKGSGLTALGCTLLGSIIGALANGPAILLLGRVVEGIGLGLITVVSPAVISMWFKPEERGTPMGIWASWVPLGSFIMFNLAGPLLKSFGWQGIWWFGAVIALAAFVLYAAVVVPPPSIDTESRESAGPDISFSSFIFNPATWMLALAFGAFNFASLAFSTWAPTYFSEGLGLDPITASFDASLTMLAVIPATIIAGWVLDRIKNRQLVLSLALLIFGILLLWCFRLGSVGVIVPYALVLGLIGGFIPTSIFTLAPESMPSPALAGLALGIISMGQNLGMFLGPPAVGAFVAGGNWVAGVIPIGIVMAIGLVVSFLLHLKRAKPTSALYDESVL